MDMGLTPGVEVVVVKSAPFHGPLEVIVRGSRLALGRGMAEKIFVVRKKRA
jgi:DtxR family Mn-dependent transcriptional regulator